MANILAAVRYHELWKPASELKAILEEPRFSSLHVVGLKEIFPNGLRRGTIAELHGSRSSGRTSICLRVLAEATSQGEVCAVVDLYDSFHPASAVSAGVQLSHLVWVRCHGNAEHAMRASDLLLHAGGFGIVSLDFCEATPRLLNRIPLSYWYRFRTAIEKTPTVLLVCADSPIAKSCSQQSLQTKFKASSWLGEAPFHVFGGLETYAAFGKVSGIRPQPLFLQTTV